jgi:hypothetical protein
MAFFAADRIKVSTTTTGTSAFGLSTATSAAFRSFSGAGVPTGSTVHYAAYTATEFECGVGVYTAAGTTLSRDTIFASSNSNNIVTFGSSPTVIVGPLANTFLPKLTADLDVYVDGNTGSDSNPGTASLPYATIQKASDYVSFAINANGNSVTIHVAADNYDVSAAGVHFYAVVGCQDPLVIFEAGTHIFTQGVLASDIDTVVCESFESRWRLGGEFKISAAAGHSGLYNIGCTQFEPDSIVEFGTCGRNCIWNDIGYLAILGDLIFSGDAEAAILCTSYGTVWITPHASNTITYSNSPEFSHANWSTSDEVTPYNGGGSIMAPSVTFVNGGTVTGPNLDIVPGSYIYVNGDHPWDEIPGDASSTFSTSPDWMAYAADKSLRLSDTAVSGFQSYDDNLYVDLGGSGTEAMSYVVESRGGTGPFGVSYWNKTNASGDLAGHDTWAKNSAGTDVYYGNWTYIIDDATNGSEDSHFKISTRSAGTTATRVRIDGDGLKFGTATAAANALNYYEQGTFSPTLLTSGVNFTSVTYDAIRGGRYTKIGNVVHFQLAMSTDAITVGSATGSVRIGNLPFTAVANTGSTEDGVAPVTVGFSFNWTGEEPSHADVLPGSTSIRLYYRSASDGNSATSAVADVNTGADGNLIYVGGTYIAA